MSAVTGLGGHGLGTGRGLEVYALGCLGVGNLFLGLRKKRGSSGPQTGCPGLLLRQEQPAGLGRSSAAGQLWWRGARRLGTGALSPLLGCASEPWVGAGQARPWLSFLGQEELATVA